MTREDYINILELDNAELKEQLENSIKVNIADHKYASECEDKVVTLEAQQKEFINWLEDEINIEKDNLEKVCKLYKISKENNSTYKFAYSYINKMEEILQKYEEIIGENYV